MCQSGSWYHMLIVRNRLRNQSIRSSAAGGARPFDREYPAGNLPRRSVKKGQVSSVIFMPAEVELVAELRTDGCPLSMGD